MTKRNYFNYSLFTGSIIIVLSGILLFSCSKDDKKVAVEKKETVEKKVDNSDAMAPDFSLINLKGETVSLSDFRGKVVILDFWATWCPPCKAEIPGFVELHSKYADQGLEIIGISLDQGDLSVVPTFTESYNVQYPILYYKDEVIMNYGGIRSIPTTFIIDKDGKIVERLVGYKPKEFFEEAIKPLL